MVQVLLVAAVVVVTQFGATIYVEEVELFLREDRAELDLVLVALPTLAVQVEL
jgi:hypothetical protein